MDDSYINHYAKTLGLSERHQLVRHWWRLFQGEVKATPFFVPHVRQLLASPAFQQTVLLMLSLEALPKQPSFQGSSFEVPVASGLIRSFPERPELGYLSLFRCVNDAATLRYFLDAVRDELVGRAMRLYLPLSPLPHLSAGLLADHWQQANPMHSLFHPPYMLELCQTHLYPTARLAAMALAADTRLAQPINPELVLAEAETADWQLLASAFDRPWLPPPSVEEIQHLRDYLAFSELYVVVAKQNDQSLGLLVLQADEGPRLRRSRGAKSVLGRLQFLAPGRLSEGRIVYLVVKPEARGQGVGSFLLDSALTKARDAGWRRLVSNPLEVNSGAAKWLLRRQAQAQQHYQLFHLDI